MTSIAPSVRLGLVGIDSSHAEDFLRHINREGRFRDIAVTALWAPEVSDERVAELRAVSPGAAIAPSLEALVESVDAVIVGDRDGALHSQHALPAIAAGKPVFVDKPLANSIADAEAIVAAADKAGTPLASGSALRWQAETQLLKARIACLKRPVAVSAYGTWFPDSDYGGAIYYAIHTIELVQELVGIDWTELRREPASSPTFSYRCGDMRAILTFLPFNASGSSAFGASVHSSEVALDRRIVLGDDYMVPVVERIVRMLKSGTGMGRDELLSPIRMMDGIATLLR